MFPVMEVWFDNQLLVIGTVWPFGFRFACFLTVDGLSSLLGSLVATQDHHLKVIGY